MSSPGMIGVAGGSGLGLVSRLVDGVAPGVAGGSGLGLVSRLVHGVASGSLDGPVRRWALV